MKFTTQAETKPVCRAFSTQAELTNEPPHADATHGWVSVSSDLPVRSMVRSASLRSCGYERTCTATPDNPDPRQPAYVVLSHASGAIVGDWAKDGIVIRDNHGGDTVARLTPAYIRNGKLGGDKLIWGSSERAKVLRADVESGVRRNISVEGDWDDKDLLLEGEKDGVPMIRAARWTPLAAAIVDVPADPNVGVARSNAAAAIPQTETTKKDDKPAPDNPPQVIVRKKESTMTEQEIKDRDIARGKETADIIALGAHYNVPQEIVTRHVIECKPLAEFKDMVLREYAGKKTVEAPAPAGDKVQRGVTDTIPADKLYKFSLMRAVVGMARAMNPSLELPKVDDGLEREVSQEAVRLIRENPEGKNYTPRGMCVPWDLVRGGRSSFAREFNIAGTGSNVVAQNLRPELFIDYLRSKLILPELGVSVLTGLVGDVLIPKQSATASASWVDETTAGASGQLTVGQIKVTPHTLGAYTDISRQLLAQSTPSADMLVMNDLTESLARSLQLAAFHGTGAANQPVGLFTALSAGYQGYDAVTEATVNSSGSPTYAEVEAMIGAVEEANIDGDIKFAMRPKAFRYFKTLGRVGTTGAVPAGSEQNGVKYVADLVTKTTTSLTSKYAAAGRWDSMVLAMWGALDLTLDPYSLSTRGALRVVALQSADVGYRYLPAFGWSSGFAASA
jgi:hypothetical protein